MRQLFCCVVFLWILSPLSAKPFVEGVLIGQLGNQMFEIAAAYSLALDNDAEPLFPRLRTVNERNAKENLKHVFWRCNTAKLPRKVRHRYYEKRYRYDPVPYEADMSMAGFFQSEKYFKSHQNEVFALFSPHEGIVDTLRERYFDILDHPKTVAVHVRTYFPDFPDGNGLFSFLGWEYFEDAMALFPDDYWFVVCSDRIDLCKKHLSGIDRKLIFIEGNAHYEDLYLMSFCKHNIISNSSFSWWSAYLNRNSEKIVIAPTPWFGIEGAERNTEDLFPDGWVLHPRDKFQ